MRVTRSLMLWLAVAMTAGGCARQPVVMRVAAVPQQGIDNVIYGAGPPGAAPYGVAAAPGYGAVPATPAYGSMAAAPPYSSVAAAPVAPAYRPLAPSYAPPPAQQPLPVYGTATPTLYATAAAPAIQTAAPPTYAAAPAPSYTMPAAPPAYAMAAPPAFAAGPRADPTARGFTGGLPFGGRFGASPISYSPMPSPLGFGAGYIPTNPQWPYTLDSGDRLRIVVFGQDGLTNSYVLDASGCIQMPLIGSVPARGLTSEQLAARIAEMLRQGFIREPHVAVEIEAYRPFFILGEVGQPGQYPYVANMTVETAVAIAGGFGPRALHEKVTISRNFGGQTFRFEVPSTFPVRPGDTVQVQERWF